MGGFGVVGRGGGGGSTGRVPVPELGGIRREGGRGPAVYGPRSFDGPDQLTVIGLGGGEA